MSTRSVRSLLEELVGHEVKIFFEDEEQRGRIAAVTDDLVVLASGDNDVLFVDIQDVTAVRVVD